MDDMRTTMRDAQNAGTFIRQLGVMASPVPEARLFSDIKFELFVPKHIHYFKFCLHFEEGFLEAHIYKHVS